MLSVGCGKGGKQIPAQSWGGYKKGRKTRRTDSTQGAGKAQGAGLQGRRVKKRDETGGNLKKI